MSIQTAAPVVNTLPDDSTFEDGLTWAVLFELADAETREWLDTHDDWYEDEPAIEDDYRWIARGC